MWLPKNYRICLIEVIPHRDSWPDYNSDDLRQVNINHLWNTFIMRVLTCCAGYIEELSRQVLSLLLQWITSGCGTLLFLCNTTVLLWALPAKSRRMSNKKQPRRGWPSCRSSYRDWKSYQKSCFWKRGGEDSWALSRTQTWMPGWKLASCIAAWGSFSWSSGSEVPGAKKRPGGDKSFGILWVIKLSSSWTFLKNHKLREHLMDLFNCRIFLIVTLNWRWRLNWNCVYTQLYYLFVFNTLSALNFQ